MPKKKKGNKFQQVAYIFFGVLLGFLFILSRLIGYSVIMAGLMVIWPSAWTLSLCRIVVVKPESFLEIAKELWEDIIGKHL